MAAPVFGASGMCSTVALVGTSRLPSANLPRSAEAVMLRRTVDNISHAPVNTVLPASLRPVTSTKQSTGDRCQPP
jgi:hypothetical protein